jgi:PIN domain nuclease of toxin-antitoxin system
LRNLLTDPSNELWISPISSWEIVSLQIRGRIRVSGNVETWLERATRSTKEAPLTHEIALVAAQLQMHRDPADRFLAATAQVLDLMLVTADEKLLGLGNIRTLANR